MLEWPLFMYISLTQDSQGMLYLDFFFGICTHPNFSHRLYKHCAALFVDLSKVFDSVDDKLLLNMLGRLILALNLLIGLRPGYTPYVCLYSMFASLTCSVSLTVVVHTCCIWQPCFSTWSFCLIRAGAFVKLLRWYWKWEGMHAHTDQRKITALHKKVFSIFFNIK